MAAEGQTIGQFLIELSDDAGSLEEYFDDPAAAVRKSGLGEEDQKLILSGDLRRISDALGEEYSGADSGAERAINIPRPRPIWPIRRPVRQVRYKHL